MTPSQVEQFVADRLRHFATETKAPYASLSLDISLHRYDNEPLDRCKLDVEWGFYHTDIGWARGASLEAAHRKALADNSADGLLKLAADLEAQAARLRGKAAGVTVS